MSESIIYAKNVVTQEVNGVQGQIIDPDVNSIGQVLAITSLEPKAVSFQDIPETTPPTLGNPDGYVLAIKDNTTGELEWKQDAQGSIPDPLVLSGADSANKFQVRDATNDPRFTIDTVSDKVIVGESTLEAQFTGIPIVEIGIGASGIKANDSSGVSYAEFDYAQKNLTIGSDNSANKLRVNDSIGVGHLIVDTLNSQLQTNANKTIISGSGRKGKFEVRNALDEGDLSIDTNSGTAVMLLKGTTDVSTKLNVTDSDSKSMLKVDTVSKRLISQADLFMVDRATGGDLYLEADGATEEVVIGALNSNNKFKVARQNGDFTFLADTGNDRVVIGDTPSGGQMYIEPANGRATMQTTTNKPELLLQHLTQGSQLRFNATDSGLAPENLIESNRPLDIFVTGAVDLRANAGNLEMTSSDAINVTANNGAATFITSNGADFTQFTIQPTGKLLMIENVLTPAKNHIEIGYSSIVSKGNPLTNTASITFQPNTSTISQSDTTMDNISINNQPTLAEHGVRLDYLQNRLGYVAAGLSASVQAAGATAGDQSLDPVTFSGTPSVPANGFVVGDSFHLVCSGDCSYNNGDVVVIEILAGASVFATISFTTPNTGASIFEVEADFTIRAINVGIAEIVSSVDFTYQDGGAFIGNRSITITNTVDTTVPNTLNVVTDLSAANAATTMQTQLYYLKKMH